MFRDPEPHREVSPQHRTSFGRPPSRRPRGFTVLELACTAAIVGLLAAIALPLYRAQIEKLAINRCVQDLLTISLAIERYRVPHGFRLPETLAELGVAATRDPWGRPYQYLSFSADVPGIKAKIRKDHNLHPLNSEFDLYSLGKDGISAAPLTAKASRDDVIWARDGAFIGLARDF